MFRYNVTDDFGEIVGTVEMTESEAYEMNRMMPEGWEVRFRHGPGCTVCPMIPKFDHSRILVRACSPGGAK